MVRINITHERNGGEITSVAEYIAYYQQCLMRTAMVWVNTCFLNPERGVWKWEALDANIRNAWAAGFRDVWIKWVGAPAHATVDGEITYQRYTAGSWSWTLDKDGNAIQPAYFDVTLPWVARPTRIKEEWVRDLNRRIIDRYRDRPLARGEEPLITGMVSLNEPDDGSSFPPNATLELDDAWWWYFNDVLRPFGASAARMSKVLGPETTSNDGLRRVLGDEALNGYCFDHLTIHLYAASLAEAIETLDKRMEIIEPYRCGRLVSITEGSDDQPWFPELVEYIRERYDGIIDQWLLYVGGNRQPCFTPESYAALYTWEAKQEAYRAAAAAGLDVMPPTAMHWTPPFLVLSDFGQKVREWNEDEERRRAVSK